MRVLYPAFHRPSPAPWSHTDLDSVARLPPSRDILWDGIPAVTRGFPPKHQRLSTHESYVATFFISSRPHDGRSAHATLLPSLSRQLLADCQSAEAFT
ncbi:hypothetical protein EYF80_055592 [Liparis tanakae]|uniref:Uncharacterized protein n=1 Tax=Liparis tanakae TaxID=230148 RepID=A0A4Z2EZL9_9TELE|nr:hypothetical protein EYF80_055592 [Liparis tanakae]